MLFWKAMLAKRAYGVMRAFVPHGGLGRFSLLLQTIGIEMVRILVLSSVRDGNSNWKRLKRNKCNANEDMYPHRKYSSISS